MLRSAVLAFAFAAAAGTPVSAAGPAYLSRTGTPASTCTQGAPCTAMSSAITVAGTGGEVVCLDKGNYGGATILNSVTISCGDALWEAPGAQVAISTPAGADVVIEGLVLDGINFPNA